LARVKEAIMTRTALTAALSVALACADTAHAATPRVEIQQFAFSPARLEVTVGTTVVWTNRDDESHTVTALDRRYTSTGLEHGESYAHRFNAPGTYTYFCALHPHMTATVVVK
jgi:plastocyanin